MKRIVFLQPVGIVERDILIKLKKDLEWVLKGYINKVKISLEPLELKHSEYDAFRRQYDASKILKRIKQLQRKENGFRILGIIEEDMYVTHLNFVFGIAQSPRGIFITLPQACLISTTRLRESFYRRPKNESLFELRILKEAIHELGHTFGLDHCREECVMRFSNCLSDTDLKPAKFCESCIEILNLNFSYLRRD
ncbi:MAG: archaemetzincin family Zn-dependent metalloprotease [Promethearchaeota archaeon]